MLRTYASACLLALCVAFPMTAQQTAPPPSAVVPSVVNFAGVLTDDHGKAMTGTVGVTFFLYKDAQGGSPLWLETQNVQPDKTGRYTVQLGSTSSQGLPASLFASGEARWLGVQPQGQEEQPRVMLTAVPYAVKALDAQTVGGLPASAFVLAPPAGAKATSAAYSPSSFSHRTHPNVGGSGTQNYIPIWTDNSGDLGNSVAYQVGSGSTAKVGINTTTPASTLDVNGIINAATGFNLGGKGFASGSYKNANAFLGFAGNSTMTGTYNFASGYQALASNTTGSYNAADGEKALHANTTGSYNTADGRRALYSNTVGNSNTASGRGALYTNTTGGYNAAHGESALTFNTTGSYNAASGRSALYSNTTGGNNTAGGYQALYYNTTGSNNTALGYNAGPDSKSTNLTNATAIGANAVVSENNALVLGGTGSNAVNVGIGTATPAATLDVEGNKTGILGKSTAGYAGNFVGAQAGVYSENDTDASFDVATYGVELGATQETIGVWGASASPVGAGVYGQSVNASSTGALFQPTSGVWGDTGQSGNFSIFGTADDGFPFIGVNNSPSGNAGIVVEGLDSTNSSGLLVDAYSAGFGGECTVDVNGNLSCTGTVSPAVPVDGGARKVALSSIAAAEEWFEDAGSGRLSNGSAVIRFEPTFAQTINGNVEYHVFLTPKGECEGLYVSNETRDGFEVHELRHGQSSVGFDYRIMAKRKGHENVRLAERTREFAMPKPEHRAKVPARPSSAQELAAHGPAAR